MTLNAMNHGGVFAAACIFYPTSCESATLLKSALAEQNLNFPYSLQLLYARLCSRPLHRQPQPFGDEARERLDLHVNAGAIQRRGRQSVQHDAGRP